MDMTRSVTHLVHEATASVQPRHAHERDECEGSEVVDRVFKAVGEVPVHDDSHVRLDRRKSVAPALSVGHRTQPARATTYNNARAQTDTHKHTHTHT